MSGLALAQAAQELVGVRFRLHGREPAEGLDCIGVLAAALAAIGRPAAFPAGYPLRLARLEGWLPDAAACGFEPVQSGLPAPGDVIMLHSAGGQYHLVLAAADQGFVHAHAGLRRVVLAPACPEGTPIGHWRLESEKV